MYEMTLFLGHSTLSKFNYSFVQWSTNFVHTVVPLFIRTIRPRKVRMNQIADKSRLYLCSNWFQALEFWYITANLIEYSFTFDLKMEQLGYKANLN